MKLFLTTTVALLFAVSGILISTAQDPAEVAAPGPQGMIADLAADSSFDSVEPRRTAAKVLSDLDQPQRDRSPSGSPGFAPHTPRGGESTSALADSRLLSDKYALLERQATQLAAEYRESLKTARAPGDADALKKQLAGIVTQAFAARQELQQAELAALRQRLARVETRLAARERVKEAIIERRVEELLDPALRWQGDENAHRSPTPNTSVREGATTTTLTARPGNHMPTLRRLLGKGDLARELGKPLWLFFHADWCPDCQKLKPKIATAREAGAIIIDVDLTHQKELLHEFNVDTVPTLILFIRGVEAQRQVGAEEIELVLQTSRAAAADAGQLRAGEDVVPTRAEQEIHRVETDRRALLQHYGPQHPRVQQVEAVLQGLRSAAASRPAAAPSTRVATEPNLQGVADLGRRLNDARDRLERVKQLAETGEETTAIESAARRDANMVQAELNAQLRLLTIAYRQANLARATAQKKLELAVAANQKVPGTVTEARLEILNHDVESAALGIERAKTLYDLCEKLRQTE